MAAFRTLWTALIGLYEETLLLLAGNLAAIALNLPIGLFLFLVGLPFASDADPAPTQLLILLIGGLMPFLPTPGNVALAGLTRVAASPDAPRFAIFTSTLRTRWSLALRCTLVSVAVMLAVALNVAFYPLRFGLEGGWPLLVSIVWLYAGLFWLSLHMYLTPLMVHVAEPRLFDLYRRAAFVALGHAGYTLLLLVVLLVFAFLAVVFLPVYLLVGPALISLVQANALREIRRRHGDLAVEAEEEVGRL